MEGGREARSEEGGAHSRFVVKGDCYMRKEEQLSLRSNINIQNLLRKVGHWLSQISAAVFL